MYIIHERVRQSNYILKPLHLIWASLHRILLQRDISPNKSRILVEHDLTLIYVLLKRITWHTNATVTFKRYDRVWNLGR